MAIKKGNQNKKDNVFNRPPFRPDQPGGFFSGYGRKPKPTSKFLKAKEQNKCATYQGKIGFFEVSSLSGHVIKDEQDLKIAKALIKII